MSSLYLRIWLTVVGGARRRSRWLSGWFVQRHHRSRQRAHRSAATERLGAWGRTGAAVACRRPTRARQSRRRRCASGRCALRLPMALDDARRSAHRRGRRHLNREADSGAPRLPVRPDDGRTLWMMRPGAGRGFGAAARAAAGDTERSPGHLGIVAARDQRATVGRRCAAAAMATGVGLAGAVGVAVRGRRRRCLPGGAQPDAAARGAEARRRAASAPAQLGQRVDGIGARRGGRGGAQLQRRQPSASRRWCARTRACWPMPATSCARRWRV